MNERRNLCDQNPLHREGDLQKFIKYSCFNFNFGLSLLFSYLLVRYYSTVQALHEMNGNPSLTSLQLFPSISSVLPFWQTPSLTACSCDVANNETLFTHCQILLLCLLLNYLVFWLLLIILQKSPLIICSHHYQKHIWSEENLFHIAGCKQTKTKSLYFLDFFHRQTQHIISTVIRFIGYVFPS